MVGGDPLGRGVVQVFQVRQVREPPFQAAVLGWRRTWGHALSMSVSTCVVPSAFRLHGKVKAGHTDTSHWGTTVSESMSMSTCRVPSAFTHTEKLKLRTDSVIVSVYLQSFVCV